MSTCVVRCHVHTGMTSRAQVELGLAAVGYEYVNIDDCWNVGRFPNGTLMPNATAFPHGIQAVADYVHSKVHAWPLHCDREHSRWLMKTGVLN